MTYNPEITLYNVDGVYYQYNYDLSMLYNKLMVYSEVFCSEREPRMVSMLNFSTEHFDFLERAIIVR